MRGGIIEREGGIFQPNNATKGIINIIGGTIKATSSYKAAISSYGTVTIGINDETINSTTPVIISNAHGIDVSAGSYARLYFYDGIFYSNDDWIDGDVDEIPSGFEFITVDASDSGYENKTYLTSVHTLVASPENGTISATDGWSQIGTKTT